jgi:hypothetical protein
MVTLGTSTLGCAYLGATGEQFAHELRFIATHDVDGVQIRAVFDPDESPLRAQIIDVDLDE